MRLGDLLAIDRDLRLRGPGVVAEHERARKGPRLAAEILHVIGIRPDHDARLLLEFPAHRGLGRLPCLNEAREGRHPADRPVHLPAEQRAIVIVSNEDDDRRIRPREVINIVDVAAK